MSATARMTREEVITLLEHRDGEGCFLGKHPFGPNDEKTFDHWMPQSWCFANGWTFEQVWDIANLRLACKPCNARKGDLIPVDDSTVPMRAPKERPVRTARPDLCETCMSGHLLLPGETCENCGSIPQPLSAPRSLTVSPKECDHAVFNCWKCFLGYEVRRPAFVTALDGEFLDE